MLCIEQSVIKTNIERKGESRLDICVRTKKNVNKQLTVENTEDIVYCNTRVANVFTVYHDNLVLFKNHWKGIR